MKKNQLTRHILLCGCNVLSCGADLPPEGKAERLRAVSDSEVVVILGGKTELIIPTDRMAINSCTYPEALRRHATGFGPKY